MKGFKVGYRVKYTSGKHGDRPSNPLWGGKYGHTVGTIISNSNFRGLNIRVEWDNNTFNSYDSDDLELVNIIPNDMFKM